MDTTQGKNDPTKSSKKVAKRAAKAAGEATTTTETAIQERVEHMRDLVEDLRDRAEIAFHERPYLLPVATGALGLGIGVLVGSKLSRVLFLTAAGAMLSDQFRGQLVRISRKIVDDLSARGGAMDPDDLEDIEPSVT